MGAKSCPVGHRIGSLLSCCSIVPGGCADGHGMSGTPLLSDLLHVSVMAATPLFDELYDTARELGAWELVLELVQREDGGPELAVVVRHTGDGSVVHRVVARSGVEEAAGRVRKVLDREASRSNGPRSRAFNPC